VREIVLYLLGGSNAGVVGVEMCRPQRTPLSEQVPALIKLCFEPAQLSAEGGSIAAVLLTQGSEQRVLERNEVGYLAQERLLSIFGGHRSPSVIQVTHTSMSAITPDSVANTTGAGGLDGWPLPRR